MSISDVLGTPATAPPSAPADAAPTASIGDLLGSTNPKVAPEEVSISPGSSVGDQEAGYSAMGINLDLAKQSKNYDPNTFNRIHKDTTNPDVASADQLDEMRRIDPEGTAVLEATQGPDTTGNFGQGVYQFGRDVSNLGTKITGSKADQENAKLNDYLQRNVNERFVNKGANIDDNGNYTKPTGQKVGYGIAATGTGIAAGAAAAAALPEVAGASTIADILGVGRGTATAINVAGNAGRGAVIGAASGAASEPTNPGQGAETGAVTGGVLSVAAQGTGAAIRAVSKNSPAVMQQVADASDALVDTGYGGKGAGIAEVLGRPNITLQRTLSNIELPDWLSRIPGAQSVTRFGKFLSGANQAQTAKTLGTQTAIEASAPGAAEASNTQAFAQSRQVVEQAKTDMFSASKEFQAAKAAGADTSIAAQKLTTAQDAYKAAQSNISAQLKPPSWVQTLQKEPVMQTKQGFRDISDPATFGKYYPQLSSAGKDAAVSGMLQKAVTGARDASTGNVNPQVFAKNIQGIMDQVGNATVKGEQKFTLQGLQKLAEMSADPNTKPILAAAKLTSGKELIVGGAMGLLDDIAGVASHGIGSALKAPVLYNLANRALDSKLLRNGLIGLAQAKTPTQQLSALASINAQRDSQD